MEEKRDQLETERQKRLLQTILKTLSDTDPDLYYRSSSDIARAVQTYAKTASNLTQGDHALLKPLSAKDIAVLLSYH